MTRSWRSSSPRATPSWPVSGQTRGASSWRSSPRRIRGLRIEGNATLRDEGVREARLAIASRYLGEADGRRYVEQRTKPGVVVRLPLAGSRSWGLGSTLPK